MIEWIGAEYLLSEKSKTGTTRRQTLELLAEKTGKRHELLDKADSFPFELSRAMALYNAIKQSGEVSWQSFHAFEQVTGLKCGIIEADMCFEIDQEIKRLGYGNSRTTGH